MSLLFSALPRLMLAACLCLPAGAGAAARLLADYAHTAWSGQQGAPGDIVKFAQSTDGWLWMASANGLFRFDGMRFERMDSVQGHRLHSTNTLGLLATPDGSLWVGHRFGGISRFSNGAMRLYTTADGLPGGAIFSMTQGPDGALWAATTQGLGLLARGAQRFRQVGLDAGLPERGARQIMFTRDGRQWVSIQGGIYWRERGADRFQRAWPHLDLMAMAETPDGTVWASDGVSKLYRVHTAPPPGNPAPRAELEGNGMHVDRDGTIWLLKGHAVERWAEGGGAAQQLSRENGISGPLPQTWFQDREGNIWIGTSAGIDRLRPTRVHTLPVDTPFDHPGILADAGGAVLIGDSLNPLRSFGAGPPRTIGSIRMSAGYRAPDGTLWIGNDRERWRGAPAGAWTRLPHPPNLVGHDVQAMTIDGAQRMWVSLSRQGLFRVDGERWERDARLPRELALALTADAAGRVWAGYVGNRIARIDGASAQVYGEADGLRLGNVQSLLVDGARVWAGGEQGVAYFDGRRWIGVEGVAEAAFRGISGMVRTASGELWLHGADGITRIAAADVARLLKEPGWPLPIDRFDANDGLPGSAEQTRPLPTLVQASDARLWFATPSDVASIDPRAIPRNRLAPPVQILTVRSGGKSYAAGAQMALPEGSSELQIAFTALSLSMPERVRFRYRLEGVDSAWQEAGGRREAFYTNVPPGEHRFQVMAANEDGVWNTAGAALNLSIAPRFVQTRAFLVLMAALAMLAVYVLYRLRLRQVTRRMDDLLRERLAERARIARGLHDTLLQSVQGLIMFFDQQARRLPYHAEERVKIEQTLELADQLMSEGRDYIMDLRADSVPQELGEALRDYGTVLLHERLSVSVEGTPCALVGAVREELSAVAREALFNAARHADAGAVALLVEYGADALRIVVRDDGRGLAGARPGHFGMNGMQERAGAVGASCTVRSQPGQGTEVHLRIAAERAYLLQPGARLLARLRRRFLKAA